MTENPTQPVQPNRRSKRSAVVRILIGIALTLIFYVASVPWVYHLTNLYSSQPLGERIRTFYCSPVRGLMKRNPSFRIVYVPYWQWTFRVVHRHMK